MAQLVLTIYIFFSFRSTVVLYMYVIKWMYALCAITSRQTAVFAGHLSFFQHSPPPQASPYGTIPVTAQIFNDQSPLKFLKTSIFPSHSKQVKRLSPIPLSTTLQRNSPGSQVKSWGLTFDLMPSHLHILSSHYVEIVQIVRKIVRELCMSI